MMVKLAAAAGFRQERHAILWGTSLDYARCAPRDTQWSNLAPRDTQWSNLVQAWGNGSNHRGGQAHLVK